MDELEQNANARLNKKNSNNGERTLCIFGEPIGIIEDFLEVGSIYSVSEALPPLVCREIIDYPKFEEKDADPAVHLNCRKIAYFSYQEQIAQKYRRKASQKQEKTLAKKMGGKVTPGSGAFGFHKGDVKNGNYLAEAKFTDAMDYRLTLRTWNKIKNEAYSVDKTPIMEIILDQNINPIKLVIIAHINMYDNFNLDDEKFVEKFFSLPLLIDKEDAKSIVLKKSQIVAHIDDVSYNYAGKLPAFLIRIDKTVLIGLETDNFIRMLNI